MTNDVCWHSIKKSIKSTKSFHKLNMYGGLDIGSSKHLKLSKYLSMAEIKNPCVKQTHNSCYKPIKIYFKELKQAEI